MDTASFARSDCSHGGTGSAVTGSGISRLFRVFKALTAGNTVHPSNTSFHHPPFKRTGNHRLGRGKYGRRDWKSTPKPTHISTTSALKLYIATPRVESSLQLNPSQLTAAGKHTCPTNKNDANHRNITPNTVPPFHGTSQNPSFGTFNHLSAQQGLPRGVVSTTSFSSALSNAPAPAPAPASSSSSSSGEGAVASP